MAEEPTLSMEGLFSKAFDQWLLADLKEVGLPCIPARLLEDTAAFDFAGKMVLQLINVLDICK